MNIYDKNQEAYKNYVPEPESYKLNKFTNAVTIELTIVVLYMILVLTKGLLSGKSCFWVNLSLYCIVFFSVLTAFWGYKYFKLVLANSKAYHDYFFCLYRNSNEFGESIALINIAELCLVYGEKPYSEFALKFVKPNKLRSQYMKKYRRIVATIDGYIGVPELRKNFLKKIKIRLYASRVAGIIGIILFVFSMVGIINTLMLCNYF